MRALSGNKSLTRAMQTLSDCTLGGKYAQGDCAHLCAARESESPQGLLVCVTLSFKSLCLALLMIWWVSFTLQFKETVLYGLIHLKTIIVRCLFNEVATEMIAELLDRLQRETCMLFGDDTTEVEDLMLHPTFQDIWLMGLLLSKLLLKIGLP